MKVCIKNIALLLALATASYACTSTDSHSSDSGSSIATLEKSMLINKEWQLVSMNNHPIEYKSNKVTPTLTFANDLGSVSGNAGCNRYIAKANVSGNNISFDNIVLTRKACINGSPEAEFIKTLKNTSTISLEGDDLKLMDSSQHALLEFVQP